MVYLRRGSKEGLCEVKFKGAIFLEVIGITVDTFDGVCKPLYNDVILGVIILVNYDPIGRLNYAQVQIRKLLYFLVCHR